MTIEKNEPAPSRVRFAERCDFDQIMFLCRELHQENGLLDWNETLVRRTILTYFNAEGGLIGVIGEPNCLEGAILLRISTMWYSNTPIVEELFSFVLPEFRRSNNAKELIDFAKNCAKQMDMKLLIGIVSNHRTEQKVKLYQRRLGTPAGAYFVVDNRA